LQHTLQRNATELEQEMLQITEKHAAEIDDWRRWQVKKEQLMSE